MAAPSNLARRGMTLIELLIVISILLILVTAATTMMQVATSGAELREAARQVNTMIAGCIARAAESGRPAGIWIDRATGVPNAGREIFYAASPPLYAGDFTTSACTVIAGATTANLQFTQSQGFYGADTVANTADDFVRPGDFVRLNFSGPWYPILTVPSASSATIDSTGTFQPKPIAYVNTPFQIRRGPRKSLVSPLQMPADTVIDFTFSGAGDTGVELDTATAGTDAVRIMFNPNGSIDRAYYNNASLPVIGTIHLLVGRQTPQAPLTSNLEDTAARWISINPQTGTVITTENMAGGSVATARQFAITGKGMGGN